MKMIHSSRQSGFGVIAYILLAIVLMAALTAALSGGGSDVAVNTRLDEARENLYSQAGYIESAILDCRTRNGFAGTGANPGFPAAASGAVSTLDCNASEPLWSGTWFYPKGIPGFGVWQYVNNNANGVYIQINADSADFANAVVNVNVRGRWGNGGLTCAAGQKACRCGNGLVYFISRGNTAPSC